jgi:hypothetical protein
LELEGELQVKRPAGFKVPSLEDLEKELPALIKAAASGFAKPEKTTVKFQE